MTPYTKDNPFCATLTERHNLHTQGSGKNTQHIVVNTQGSNLAYASGDSLGVWATNDPHIVQGILAAWNLDGSTSVTVPKKAESCTLEYALLHHLSLQPTPNCLKYLHTVCPSSELESLLDPTQAEALQAYLSGKDLLDIAQSFASHTVNAQDLVNALRRLMPRLYSIASSPHVYPNEIHLTVAVVEYEAYGRKRQGIASSFLAERAALGTPTLPVFVTHSHFKLPEDPASHVIMVGPGTGVAPFRAFMQERRHLKAIGHNWLFFGNPHRASDYLYKAEWEQYQHEGTLTRLSLAFSRDQAHKVYVQDKMKAEAATLFEWLEKGAYFYVCGDAKRMAKDVDKALHEIIQEQGALSEEAAKEYVRNLKQTKRYQRDVY